MKPYGMVLGSAKYVKFWSFAEGLCNDGGTLWKFQIAVVLRLKTLPIS
jgi:hypothetical protein